MPITSLFCVKADHHLPTGCPTVNHPQRAVKIRSIQTTAGWKWPTPGSWQVKLRDHAGSNTQEATDMSSMAPGQRFGTWSLSWWHWKTCGSWQHEATWPVISSSWRREAWILLSRIVFKVDAGLRIEVWSMYCTLIYCISPTQTYTSHG